MTAYGDTDSFLSNSTLGLLNHLDLRARRILNSRDYFVMHTITELINLCTYNLILFQPSEVRCNLVWFGSCSPSVSNQSLALTARSAEISDEKGLLSTN